MESTRFADGRSESSVYDALGRIASKEDPLGRLTLYGYDPLGHLTGVTDALGQVTTYEYDEIGNRITQTDANHHTTRFVYDERQHQTKRILPDGAFESRTFALTGEVATRTDFLGRTTRYTYDLRGRLKQRLYPDGSTAAFTYTPTGERASATDARGQTQYTYDLRGRPLTLVYPDGRELDYAYDARGARTALTAKLGASTWTTSTRYDADGRPTEVTDPTGRKTTFLYDLAGQRTALAYPNATSTSYSYDPRGRVASIHATAGATEIATFNYTMDAAGRRTRIDETGGVVRTYGYDGIDRLTSETVTGALAYAKTFAYDPVGNRLTQTTTGAGAGSVGYAYDNRDRLLTENATAYGYDANGNTTSKSGEATYAWDLENRLTSVSTTSDGVVANDYDVDGNRVKTTVTPPSGPAAVTNMLVDTVGGLSHVVAETDAGGALTALYVRAGDELLAVMRPAGGGGWTTRWGHHDALGSVRALTDEAGVVVDARSYEAFGTMNVEAGSDPLPYRFAGEPFEVTSRLAYHRARWMDSRVGRFHGMDPARGSKRDPASLHRYLYAASSPANFIDPSGRQYSMSSVSVGVVGVGVLANLSVAHATFGSVLHGGGVPDAVGFGALYTGGSVGGAGVLRAGFIGVEFIFWPKLEQAGVVVFGDAEYAAEFPRPDVRLIGMAAHPKRDVSWYTAYYFGFEGWDPHLSTIGGIAARGGFVGLTEDEFLVGGSFDPGTELWAGKGGDLTLGGPWTLNEGEMTNWVAAGATATSAANAFAFAKGAGSAGTSIGLGGLIAAPVNAATAALWVSTQYGR